jgi:putative spermidine/putrescine transport system ATP-binding protein
VADFMGYRNLLTSRVEPAEGGVAVTVGGARLLGTPRGSPTGDPTGDEVGEQVGYQVGAPVTVAIRPEDLVPTPDGPISATVEVAEYHGKDFYAVLRGADGGALYCRSNVRIRPGDVIRLAARPERVLVYAGDGRGAGAAPQST